LVTLLPIEGGAVIAEAIPATTPDARLLVDEQPNWSCSAESSYLPSISVEANRSPRGKGAWTILWCAVRAPILAIIDGNAGPRRAVEGVWPGAAVQRCCVHKLRNLERKAPKHAFDDIRDDFHRIVSASTHDAARAAYAIFERTWGKRCPGVVTSLREGGDELLTFFRFPKVQRKTLRTTNTIEAPRRIPPAREDARLAAERGRRRRAALQPRGERANQVAEN